MFQGISWMQYIGAIILVLAGYYIAVGWMYRKELLQWWKERKKE
ncbi:MAG: hypothetical protein U1C70_02355 [Sediminibacterium sp.]|jgi:hypothetical protein|nr:hypothetical protein [Sediminibacterium sp.]MDZ4070642.1 hypothetical protein [Sediminibacterium sp.]